jgi:hypothetical protein
MAQYNRLLIASLLAFISLEPTYFVACAHKQKDPMEAYFESVAADLAQAEQEEQAAAACRTGQVQQQSTPLRVQLDSIERRIHANIDSIRQMVAITASRRSGSIGIPQPAAAAVSQSVLHSSEKEELQTLKVALSKIRQIHNKLIAALNAAEEYINILARQGITSEEIISAHERYIRLYTDVFDYGIGALPERLEPLSEGYYGICARILDICSNPSNLYVKCYSSEIKELWLIVKTQIWPTLKEEVHRLEVKEAATSSHI